ncbi:MarR family transcriptional regulator [Piscinibacter sakaiensis]|uniref:Transcriptional regulator, MarR family n=1 Tax=Piscinibacter sakaiensis TaxID=1547922 RepID=A0A0K8P573_PISS1|nr:MarR family transcriptional regulator [Piscinibacter sakaiensis]GAP37797.1 transcriptional regulator, MarR family [Piscinibacter sakaiensis]
MTSPTPAADESTPRGGLGEGAIHRLLGYRLAQAAVVTTHAFEREVGEPLGLRPVEFTILQLVHENPHAGPSHLSKALDISRPGVKQWLDRLEARQLLRRAPHETDGRAHRLALTREGARLLATAVERLLQADEALLAGLSTGEQHLLIELLKKVARLDEARPRG